MGLMKENETAPNDTAYKRWSCHSGTQAAVQNCVEPPRPPEMGGPIYRFLGHAGPCGPAGWLALLLTKAGDVEDHSRSDNFKQESLDL